MQGFADIDVAEPGDEPLVEERGLEGCGLAGHQPGQGGGIEVFAKGLDADVPKQRMPVELRFRDQRHEAEAAWVVVGDRHAVIEDEADVVVRAAGRRLARGRGRVRRRRSAALIVVAGPARSRAHRR